MAVDPTTIGWDRNPCDDVVAPPPCMPACDGGAYAAGFCIGADVAKLFCGCGEAKSGVDVLIPVEPDIILLARLVAIPIIGADPLPAWGGRTVDPSRLELADG